MKLIAEAVLISLAFWLAFSLRFDGYVPDYYRDVYLRLLPGLIALRIGTACVVTRYRRRWRTTSLADISSVFLAVALGSFLFFGLIRWTGVEGFPRSVFLLESFLTLNLLGILRVSARIYWNLTRVRRHRPLVPTRRVLVVGAGASGARIVREMQHDPSSGLQPVAFADDDRAKQNCLIYGVQVRGTTRDIPRLVHDLHIDQILIAISSLNGADASRIVRHCALTRADLTILPSLPELLSSTSGTRDIRRVKVEDLLERTPVRVDMEEIAGYTRGLRVLVTGAGGSIGSELCRQLVSLNPAQLILVGNEENSVYWIEHELRNDYSYNATSVIADIKDRHRLEEVFQTFRPEVVFHAAAHKHVPLMEANPHEAVKNNIFGTRNLAELSIAYGVKSFVMISTDKAVNPTSVMGTTKRVAETVVQSLAQRISDARQGRPVSTTWGFEQVSPEKAVTRFSSVRFGNVLGSNGSVIPTMQRQIEKGGPVTVTHEDMVRYFMTIPEAVQLVIQAGAMGERGEIFVLDMGKPVRIMDLAYNLIRLSGLIPEVDIDIQVTGIRPGEKLYEEVLTAEEGVTMTSHEKICVARSSPVDHVALERGLKHLAVCAYQSDPIDIRLALAGIVPSYQPISPDPEPVPAPVFDIAPEDEFGVLAGVPVVETPKKRDRPQPNGKARTDGVAHPLPVRRAT